MSDLFLTMSGDLLVNGNKDISVINSGAQNDVQQIYIRLMTEPGDFQVYPNLGTDLGVLYGMPQSRETGELGQRVIRAALEKEDIFKGRKIEITAVPTSADSIRFDVHITTDSNEPIILSVTQNL